MTLFANNEYKEPKDSLAWYATWANCAYKKRYHNTETTVRWNEQDWLSHPNAVFCLEILDYGVHGDCTPKHCCKSSTLPDGGGSCVKVGCATGRVWTQMHGSEGRHKLKADLMQSLSSKYKHSEKPNRGTQIPNPKISRQTRNRWAHKHGGRGKQMTREDWGNRNTWGERK